VYKFNYVKIQLKDVTIEVFVVKLRKSMFIGVLK